MKKLFFNIVLFMVMINAACYLGCYLSGNPFDFNFIINIVSPILCAVTAWTIEMKKTKKLTQNQQSER